MCDQQQNYLRTIISIILPYSREKQRTCTAGHVHNNSAIISTCSVQQRLCSRNYERKSRINKNRNSGSVVASDVNKHTSGADELATLGPADTPRHACCCQWPVWGSERQQCGEPVLCGNYKEVNVGRRRSGPPWGACCAWCLAWHCASLCQDVRCWPLILTRIIVIPTSRCVSLFCWWLPCLEIYLSLFTILIFTRWKIQLIISVHPSCQLNLPVILTQSVISTQPKAISVCHVTFFYHLPIKILFKIVIYSSSVPINSISGNLSCQLSLSQSICLHNLHETHAHALNSCQERKENIRVEVVSCP